MLNLWVILLLVLTMLNNEQQSRPNSSWSQANDILTLPSGIITLSNEPHLYHHEPIHNHALYINVEHHNKVIYRTLFDLGTSTNLLIVRILYELGYTLEHLVSSITQFSSISHTTCDSMRVIFLHISVGLFSMTHILHVVEFDQVFHMLLTHPLIHDHHCIPSSWHKCIKVVQIKGNQV